LLGRNDLVSRIRVIPPPAAEIAYDKSIGKARRIIAVGRWESYQKDAPKLIQVLGRTLADQKDYSAVLAGDGEGFLRRLVADLPTEIQSRITISGHLEHDRLQREYQQAQIILFTSRYEGFPFSAGEALCAGCTVVGATELAAINYICSRGAGTAAIARSTSDFAYALNAEIEAWRRGERDPERLSRWWQERLAPKCVASAFLSTFSDDSHAELASDCA
jgi:glycosyltransferase involved in cell wall biosynthesis